MNAGRAVAVGLGLVIVVAFAAPAVVDRGLGTSASNDRVFQQEFDADSVLLDVSVLENGTARWTVRYRLALETDNETAAFEELQADIQQNRSAFLRDFESRIQSTVTAAENATGRDMTARDFAVSTSTQPVSESGFVTYTFTWENFAAVDGSTLRIGDAIAGLFLDSQTSLTIGWPTGYELDRVAPQYDQRGDRSVTWNGRLSFASDEPRVIVTPAGLDIDEVLPWVIGAALVLALVLGGVLIYRREEPSSTPAPLGSDSSAGGGTATGSNGAEAPPSELLSNEERVLQLLEANGGRMKQQEVVAELGWTEAKTSQVVNGMREDDELEVFRIGRENVLKLPDDESDLT